MVTNLSLKVYLFFIHLSISFILFLHRRPPRPKTTSHKPLISELLAVDFHYTLIHTQEELTARQNRFR